MTPFFKPTILALTVAAMLFAGCFPQVYPDERMKIDPAFESLYNSVIQKDSLRFRTANGREKVFVVTGRDSTILNGRGLFMNPPPYKQLESALKEAGSDTLRLERPSEVYVNKDPGDNVNTIAIKFNNLYYLDTLLPPVSHESLKLGNRTVDNYHIVKTKLASKNPDDVQIIYIAKPEGILGFRTKAGDLWTREN